MVRLEDKEDGKTFGLERMCENLSYHVMVIVHIRSIMRRNRGLLVSTRTKSFDNED